MAETWLQTVFSDSTSRRAISWLPKPAATSSSTSRSRAVNSGTSLCSVGVRLQQRQARSGVSQGYQGSVRNPNASSPSGRR
jgi:hypothetical protein